LLGSIAPEIQEGETALGTETLKQRSRKVETEEIRAMLESFGGDREKVARALGISKTTLWRKLSGR
jgi:propionate catabolism operon transcriptional regulator